MPISEDIIVQTLIAERARLLAYIWAIVRDDPLVEDVFQEVSLLAVRERENLRDAAALGVWLQRTARFKSLSALRDRSRQGALLSGETLDQLDLQWQVQAEQTRTEDFQAALRRCLRRLSPYAQRVVALRYVEGLKGTEVAERLGRKTKSIYMALTRIHKTLRDCIDRETRTPEA